MGFEKVHGVPRARGLVSGREEPGKRALEEHPFLGFQEPPTSLSPWQDRCVTTWRLGVCRRGRADQSPPSWTFLHEVG